MSPIERDQSSVSDQSMVSAISKSQEKSEKPELMNLKNVEKNPMPDCDSPKDIAPHTHGLFSNPQKPKAPISETPAFGISQNEKRDEPNNCQDSKEGNKEDKPKGGLFDKKPEEKSGSLFGATGSKPTGGLFKPPVEKPEAVPVNSFLNNKESNKSAVSSSSEQSTLFANKDSGPMAMMKEKGSLPQVGLFGKKDDLKVATKPNESAPKLFDAKQQPKEV